MYVLSLHFIHSFRAQVSKIPRDDVCNLVSLFLIRRQKKSEIQSEKYVVNTIYRVSITWCAMLLGGYKNSKFLGDVTYKHFLCMFMMFTVVEET